MPPGSLKSTIYTKESSLVSLSNTCLRSNRETDEGGSAFQIKTVGKMFQGFSHLMLFSGLTTIESRWPPRLCWTLVQKYNTRLTVTYALIREVPEFQKIMAVSEPSLK